MSTLETIRTFKTSNFTVTVRAVEDSDLDTSWDDDGSVVESLNNGNLMSFGVVVTVSHNGATLGEDSLWGCIHTSPRDFMDHVGIRAESRADGRNYGSYFSNMVRSAIAEARKTLADMRLEQEAGYTAWLRGETGEYFNPRLFPTAFRVEGEEFVSTLGARVPLHDARVSYRFARTHKNWHRNGETCPVGPYQLDAINDQGIVAGCHRITWAEMERLAPVLA